MSSVIDQALKDAGVGLYQVLHFPLLVILGRFTYIWQVLVILFAGYYNDHHCKLPANVTKDEMIPVIIGPDGDPMYEQCMQYTEPGSNLTMECPNGWDFDPEYFDPNDGTIVMEWNLVCGNEGLVEITIVLLNIGFFLGNFFFSSMGDNFGRKLIFIIATLCLIVSGTASAFVPEIISFSVFQFIKGLFCAGSFTQGLVLLGEIFPKHLLPIIIPIAGALANISQVIFCGIALLFRQWRHLQLAASLIIVVFIPYFWWCPESIHWLVDKGKVKDAEKILQSISRMNKGKYKEGSLEEAQKETQLRVIIDGNTNNSNNQNVGALEVHANIGANSKPQKDSISMEKRQSDMTNKEQGIKKQHPLLDYFKRSRPRRYMIIMCYLDFVIMITYYGLVYMTGSLTGDLYLNTAINGLIGIPVCFLCIPIIKFCGRKYPTIFFIFFLAFFMALSAAAEFFPVPAGFDEGILSTVFALTAKFGEVGLTQVKILYAQELLPTNIRSSGIGIQTACGYLGALIAPFISITLIKIQFWIPGTMYAIFALIGGFLAFLLPETKGRNLPESAAEVDSWPLALTKEEKEALKARKVEFPSDSLKSKEIENEGFEEDNLDMPYTIQSADVSKTISSIKDFYDGETYM